MLTSGKTPFAVGGETAIRRVGRVAECTSPLTRQAVRLRRFESSTLRNFISGYGTDYYRKPRCIGHTRKKCREYRDRGYNLRHRTAVYCNAHRRFGVHRLPTDCGESGEIRDRKLCAASCTIFRPLGDIAAVLILGAKNLTEERVVMQEKRYLFGLIKRRSEKKIKVDKRAELAKAILENVRPTVLFNVVVQRLQDMEISSFFAITTSLSEANILKPTKEVVKG